MAGSPQDEIVYSLNRLAGSLDSAGHPTLAAAGAANKWAGTVGLELLGALNAKNNSTGLGLNAVCCALAGVPSGTYDAQLALSKI